MPMPIRPTHGGIFDRIDDKEFENNTSLSDIMLDQYRTPAADVNDSKVKFRKATSEQKELLYKIWEHGHKNTKQAAIQEAYGVPENKTVYKLPSSVSFTDRSSLVSSGLLENVGTDLYSFTDAGKMALSQVIMDQPSEFDK